MKTLNTIAATATIVLTLVSGHVLADQEGKVTIINNLGVSVSGHQSTTVTNVNDDITIGANSQDTFNAASETSGIPTTNNVLLSIPAPEGESPADTNFSLNMTCNSDGCYYSSTMNGQPDWLVCTGDCEANGANFTSKSVTLSYSTTSHKKKK
jgi:hypothetical protein